MDSVLEKSKSTSVADFLTTKTLEHLRLDTQYHILAMRNVATRFGDSVVCDIEEPGECPQEADKKFSVFLPKRYAGVYSDEDLAAVPSCKLALTVRKHVALANGKKTYDLDVDSVIYPAKDKARRQRDMKKR